jgi:hypothetical protein
VWITADVNVPDALLAAQREDRLVIFAGAGVSVDSPSSLPLFRSLARRIGSDAGIVASDKDLDSPDRFLGDLDLAGRTNVHRRVADILGTEDSAPNLLHTALLRLAVAGGRELRLVTTNYDLHFSRAAEALQIPAPRFDAPALPLGDDFAGIVHLHGSLEQPPARLVVTDQDFGHAYLTDAWAAQFLQRMFRRYTVLFVGYSHADVVMDYLARGLPRGTSRYALAADDDLFKWRRLDIEAVPYPRSVRGGHEALSVAIVEWADRTSLGLLDRRQRIADLVSAPPPEEPVIADYLAEALTTESTAAFFAEFARGADWLAWAETQDSFKQLAMDTSDTVAAPALAHWFASNFVVVESESQRALKTIQLFGGRIGALLWHQIAAALFRAKDARPSTLQSWVVLLLETAPAYASGSLDFLLTTCRWPEDREAALLLLEHLISPHLTIHPTFPIWTEPSEVNERHVRADVSLRGKQHWLAQAWQTLFVPHMIETASELATMVSRALTRAHRMLTAFDAATHDWDPCSFGRSAIEPHPQDQHPEPIDVVIDIARDSLEHLLDHNVDIGSTLIASWAQAQAPLLRRLAIHGWAHRDDKTPDEKVSWLLADGRLFDHAAKHEVFRLLQVSMAAASIELRNTVIDTIQERTPESEYRDYSIYNYLVWITIIDPDLAEAAAKLALMQQEHPDFGPREHPDLDHWMSSGFAASTFPLSTEAMHIQIATDPQSALREILSYENAEPFARSDWSDALQQVSAVVSQWPEDGHTLLVHLADLDDDSTAAGLWRAVISGWSSATLDHDQWSSALSRLDAAPTSVETTYAIAQLLEHGARSQDSGLTVDLVSPARRIARSIWTTATGIDTDPDARTGWYGAAINTPAGATAEFWMHSIAIEWRDAQDTWTGLPAEVAADLQAMICDPGPRGAAARAILGGQLLFLFGADEAWCAGHLLSVFDWDSTSAAFAAQAWDGYLQVGRWNERLLRDHLLDLFVKATTHIETDLPGRRDRFCEYLAAVAIISEANPIETGWLQRFVSQASQASRTAWASGVRATLHSGTTELAERRWSAWMRTYWQQRIDSIPAPLDLNEAAAMAAWAPHLGEAFPEAVRLAVASPAPLDHKNLLVHSLIETGTLARYPKDTIRLLTHLLTHTALGAEPEYQLEECVRLLRHDAQEGELRPLAEAAIRVGYQSAGQWIDDEGD